MTVVKTLILGDHFILAQLAVNVKTAKIKNRQYNIKDHKSNRLAESLSLKLGILSIHNCFEGKCNANQSWALVDISSTIENV